MLNKATKSNRKVKLIKRTARIAKTGATLSRKLLVQLLIIPFVSLSLISCESEEFKDDGSENEVEAIFTSTINRNKQEYLTTRATGVSWNKSDAVGIFAIKNGQSLSETSIYKEYRNVKYINHTTGEQVTFEVNDNKITFPYNGDKLDFVAYYPYNPTGSDFILPIDISDQEQRSAIDVMYSTAYSYSSELPVVPLNFVHVLSLYELNITSNEDINLKGAKVEIDNARINASLNLVDGTVTIGEEMQTVSPVISYDSIANRLTASTVLLPGQELSDLKVNIVLSDESSYVWTPEKHSLLPDVKQVYLMNLTHEEVKLISGGFTIKDWDVVIDDTVINLTPVSTDTTEVSGDPELPDLNLGNGTIEKPYTVIQAIDNQPAVAVWVEGYITGFAEGFGYSLTLNTDTELDGALYSIVLSEEATETDIKLMLPIDISNSSESVLASLNLKENSQMLGQKVKILCDLAHFKGVPGGTNPTDYVIY